MQLKQFYYIATKVSSRKKCYYFWWSTWLLSPRQGQGSFKTQIHRETIHQGYFEKNKNTEEVTAWHDIKNICICIFMYIYI